MDHVGERPVSLAVPRLNLQEVDGVGRESFDGGGHLVADDALADPLAVVLRAVSRVGDDVAGDLAVGLFRRLPVQVDDGRVVVDQHDRQIARRRRRSRFERRVWHHQTPRALPAILFVQNKNI